MRSHRWSPDSKRIAIFHEDIKDTRKVNIPYFEREDIVLKEYRRDFTVDLINEKKVGIVEITEGKIKWIDLKFENLITLAWSPSGEKLLMEDSFEYADKRNLYIAKMSDLKISIVYHEENPRNTFSWMWGSGWLDDNQLALTSDKDGFCHLYSLDLRNKELKQLTSGKWEVFRIYPTSGRDVYFIANKIRPENRDLFKVNTKNGKIERVVDKDGVYMPFISNSGQNVCVLFSDDDSL